MRWVGVAGLLVCAALTVWLVAPTSLSWLSIQFGQFRDQPDEPVSRVLFAGDVLLGRAVERYFKTYPTETSLQHLNELIATYDQFVINFEAAIPNVHVPTPDFGFQFSVATATVARHIPGGTWASLANNHSFDFGDAGYRNTRTALETAEVVPFGHPQQRTQDELTLEGESDMVHVLAFNDVGVTLDLDVASTQIDSLKATQNSIVVVYIHWGDEYVAYPNDRQRAIAQALAVAGADLIVGHHPHVVQSIERVDGTLVLYSLGNTVFDQYFSREVQEGLLAGVQYDERGWSVALYPISSLTSRHRPQLLDGEERAAALQTLADISPPELRAEIEAGRIVLQ